MITSVSIENLRGIREGRLDGLAPLTVLVGPNGSGKSTVLDALLIGGAGAPRRAPASRSSGAAICGTARGGSSRAETRRSRPPSA